MSLSEPSLMPQSLRLTMPVTAEVAEVASSQSPGSLIAARRSAFSEERRRHRSNTSQLQAMKTG